MKFGLALERSRYRAIAFQHSQQRQISCGTIVDMVKLQVCRRNTLTILSITLSNYMLSRAFLDDSTPVFVDESRRYCF